MEVYVPRVVIYAEAGQSAILLECGCGYAMPYPGQQGATAAMQCDRCGTTWRVVSFRQLAELHEGRQS